MNIIYGGSFDPFHKGHLAVIKGVLDAFSDANIIVSPVTQNRLKAESHRQPIEIRTKIIFQSLYNEFPALILARISVIPGCPSTLEFVQNSKVYGFEFKKETDMILIGSDVLPQLPKWLKWEEELQFYKFLVGGRIEEAEMTGIENLTNFKILKVPAAVRLVAQFPLLYSGKYGTENEILKKLSSTTIRGLHMSKPEDVEMLNLFTNTGWIRKYYFEGQTTGEQDERKDK